MSSNSSSKNDFISLPKGGGALSGLGEKFTADLHTGTGNFSIPIDIPAGRNEFQPALNIEYSTGNSNGLLGLGWELSIPSISRKVSKGIPLYMADRDTFILNGGEDLVKINETGSAIEFRPRIESQFAQIIYNHDNQNSFWLLKNKNGYISTYGTPLQKGNDVAVISDPVNVQKEFAWCITKMEDSFKNAIEFNYIKSMNRSCGYTTVENLIDRIDYINYPEGSAVKYLVSIQIVYEDRPDTTNSFRCGFEQSFTKRISEILIKNNIGSGNPIKKYKFSYLNDELTGLSLLKKVQVNRGLEKYF